MDRRTFIGAAGAGALAALSDAAAAQSRQGATVEGGATFPVDAPPGARLALFSPGQIPMKALLVDGGLDAAGAPGEALRALVEELGRRRILVATTGLAEDAIARIEADAGIQALLLDWNLGGDPKHAADVVAAVRARNADLPILLLAEDGAAVRIPPAITAEADGLIALLSDTTDFVGGRVENAIGRYRDAVMPPMFRALVAFAGVDEYSWHTPGHTGGTGFLTAPAGWMYHQFFGESLLRNDLSISVEELGSLLDHSGPIGAAERNAARVFGADRTLFVTNGSSMSNRVILMASVARGQVALCDRNCHKSVEHAMTMSGAVPCYLMPTRNGLGIIGPIPAERMEPEAVAALVAANPLAAALEDRAPVHAVVTNSTYDGLCVDAVGAEDLLGQSVDRVHFDEAWYGYARFNPIYAGRFAMHGEPGEDRATRPTVFATQSTHKLLAALSQASMIHVRDGRNAIPAQRFDEAYMMHASTSPLYPLIASIDVAAAMMDGPGGAAITGQSIREAIDFRQAVARERAAREADGDWFFAAWQPDEVTLAGETAPVAFEDAPPDRLATDPGAWLLRPGAAWHGFAGLDDGWAMLDPIKVSLVTPGATAADGIGEAGIPAPVVSAFLDGQGIEVEKTTDFTILLLFSLGVTPGKWGTLLSALHEFKRHHDANTPLERAIPAIAAAGRGAYDGMGVRDLSDAIFAAMRELRTTALLSEAFAVLPAPDLSPADAYARLVRGEAEPLGLDGLAGRTVATGVVPYPPGIPLLMPGENAGPADGPIIGYLKALEAFDRRFPGFAHDIHGIEPDPDGSYRLLCLTPPMGAAGASPNG